MHKTAKRDYFLKDYLNIHPLKSNKNIKISIIITNLTIRDFFSNFININFSENKANLEMIIYFVRNIIKSHLMF